MRWTEVSHLLVHSSNAQNSQDWARSQPGAGNSTQVTQVCGRALSSQAIICYLPDSTVAGSWNTEQSLRLKLSYFNRGLQALPRSTVTTVPNAHPSTCSFYIKSSSLFQLVSERSLQVWMNNLVGWSDTHIYCKKLLMRKKLLHSLSPSVGFLLGYMIAVCWVIIQQQ